MTTKLTAITPSYSSFEDDQVLTARQLNQFLNYFEDQDRMSRVCLSGVGIVCGFKVNFTPEKTLILSQGCGITTDGDLIHLQKNIPDSGGLKRIDITELIYTNFAPFIDDKAIYKPFFYKDTVAGPVQIPLWEVIPSDQVIDEQPISALANLEDKVVLLYLESYNEDPDLCVGITCDNLGVKEEQRLRVLLVSQENANYILEADSIFNAGNLFSTYMNLSDVAVPRVILNQVNTLTFSALSESYKNAIKADYVVDNMKTSFTAMLGKVGMNAEAVQINNQLNALFGLSAVIPTLYFQYRYDALKDVVDTYMEMKELFLNSYSECCPNIHSFPKHLMLGKLIPTAEDTIYKRYRHLFYKSAILGHEQDNHELFKSLVNRVIQQMNYYIVTNIPKGDIKIIPSRFNAPLGNKAIPYYYNLQLPLLNAWNYEKTKRNKQRRNLSYHTSLLDNAAAIQTPLKYNLEPFNFLSVQGHQGYLYPEALTKINDLKVSNGLSFDVKALGITIAPNETINIADYACEFADLSMMLDTWRAEYECVLGNASYYLSSYSVNTPWENDREFTFYQVQLKSNVALRTLGEATVSNVVYEKMDRKAGTAGKYIADTYQTFIGCSANDLIVQIQQAMANVNFVQYTPMVYDLTILSPVQILAHSLELMNKLPRTLPELTQASFNAFSQNASYICSLAKRVQGVGSGDVPATQPPIYASSTSAAASTQAVAYRVAASTEYAEATTVRKGSFAKDFGKDYQVYRPYEKEPTMIATIMDQLVTLCCSITTLETILKEIEKRKQRILLNLKLSKFIESNPGLEHFAGTKHGGTFLLVYITNPVNGIAANTVVADFSLPYMCCGDCNTVNFITPRPDVTLFLSKDTFDVFTETGPLIFTAYPANGVIKSAVEVPGMQVFRNQLTIDPMAIPESIFGVPVYFTLNGYDTGCNLTFYSSGVATQS